MTLTEFTDLMETYFNATGTFPYDEKTYILTYGMFKKVTLIDMNIAIRKAILEEKIIIKNMGLPAYLKDIIVKVNRKRVLELEENKERSFQRRLSNGKNEAELKEEEEVFRADFKKMVAKIISDCENVEGVEEGKVLKKYKFYRNTQEELEEQVKMIKGVII